MSRHFLPLVFLCILSVFAVSVLAESSVWKFPVAADSEDLKTAMSALSRSERISGSFRQTRTVVKINRSFQSTGTFEISRTEGITWNIEKPFASKMRLTDSSVVQIDSDGNQTIVSSKDNAVFDEISRTMRAVFHGDLSVLQKRFDIYFVQNKKRKSWQVGLIPREKMIRNAIRSIELQGSQDLEKVHLVDGEGNLLDYEFGK